MDIMEISRTLAEEGKTAEAVEAYTAALQQILGKEPESELEAAIYLLQFGEDYKLPYTCLYYLYQRGFARGDILAIMEQAFYAPNVKLLKKRYEKNCKLLMKYPYLFRRDFVPFEDLPLCFFPYEDGSYYPLDLTTGEFYPLFTPKDAIISRNFFKDLENPILADDVYSQYELEYLYDNIRKSEWVAKENHIYLHYTNWAVFCAYLQVLDLRPVLDDKKIVFLMEDEISRYPIDFKAEYGIDYSQYPVKPVGIREISRLIWHVQLTAHNGGDFFDEVFDEHPNLVCAGLMMDVLEKDVKNNLKIFAEAKKRGASICSNINGSADTTVTDRIYEIADLTEKDVLVAMYLNLAEINATLDPASRIAPVLFLQPHFSNQLDGMTHMEGNELQVHSGQRDLIAASPLFRGFKYVKSFSPMRRPTTSFAASMRYGSLMAASSIRDKNKLESPDDLPTRVLLHHYLVSIPMSRAYMADPDDRMQKDSVIVRFEDAKLNPRATFSALAAFLDLPYTESMTYCSENKIRNPLAGTDNERGFDTAVVYRKHDDYANDEERCFVEYCWRDAYACYGYDFHYYDGKPMTEEQAQYLVDHFTTYEKWFRYVWEQNRKIIGEMTLSPKQKIAYDMALTDECLEEVLELRNSEYMAVYRLLSKDIKFVNKNRRLMRMIPLLKIDPTLMETELYH